MQLVTQGNALEARIRVQWRPAREQVPGKQQGRGPAGLYLSMRKTVWSLRIMRKGQLLQSRTHYTPGESYPFGVP